MGSIHVRAWRAAYSGGLMPDEYLDSLSDQERSDMWRRVLSQPAADRAARFVIEDSTARVVGFALVGPEGSDEAATVGELHAINVDPDSWGTGAGTALHDAALEALGDAGFGRAVLWVHRDNQRARRFYESRGWQTDGAERVESVLGVQAPEVRYAVGLS